MYTAPAPADHHRVPTMRTMRVTKRPNGESSGQDRPAQAVMPAPLMPPPCMPPPSMPPPSMPPPSMPPPSMPPPSMPPPSMPPPCMLVLTEDEVPGVAREEEVHTIDLWKMPLPPSKRITILQDIRLNTMPPPPPAANRKVIAAAPTPASKPILIVSWKIGGIRIPEKMHGVQELLASGADIICLQDVRCGLQDLPSEFSQLDAYHQYWSETRPGYSGCSCWSKEMPKHVATGIGYTNMEGRIITVEFAKFFLINVNVPNAGRNLMRLDKRMEWNLTFERYCKKLDEIKPLIIIGNMNVAHTEQDLARPRNKHNTCGFSIQERTWMTNFLASGFIDTFRYLKPIDLAYTFWPSKGNARANNVGWRLDYAIVSERIIGKVTDCSMWRQVRGSVHCPIAMMIWKP